MRPQKQLNVHDPKNGIHGDCHRTAIACIFDMDAQDVPHFCQGDDFLDTHRREKLWLKEQGMSHMHWASTAETLEEVLAWQQMTAPNVPMVLMGDGGRGVNHSVVILNGDVVCDPTTGFPNPAALSGPADDGRWWITIFTKAFFAD